MNMIIEYIGCITKENQIDYLHQKEQWKERVLSFVQVFFSISLFISIINKLHFNKKD